MLEAIDAFDEQAIQGFGGSARQRQRVDANRRAYAHRRSRARLELSVGPLQLGHVEHPSQRIIGGHGSADGSGQRITKHRCPRHHELDGSAVFWRGCGALDLAQQDVELRGALRHLRRVVHHCRHQVVGVEVRVERQFRVVADLRVQAD
jgi:hypothetical protein